jgi:hypothetical protein
MSGQTKMQNLIAYGYGNFNNLVADGYEGEARKSDFLEKARVLGVGVDATFPVEEVAANIKKNEYVSEENMLRMLVVGVAGTHEQQKFVAGFVNDKSIKLGGGDSLDVSLPEGLAEKFAGARQQSIGEGARFWDQYVDGRRNAQQGHRGKGD